jgi:hypothetical protein
MFKTNNFYTLLEIYIIISFNIHKNSLREVMVPLVPEEEIETQKNNK